jgi:hypothetical protein
MPLALDVPRLLKRISHKEGDRENSRDYQRDIAAEFTKRADKMSPVATERWRQRGMIPTPRLLLLLKIAEERGITINLLDFAMSDEATRDYRLSDHRVVEARKKQEMEARRQAAKIGSRKSA